MSSGDPTSNARNPIVGLVLAGGQSRRMGGGDKALADLGGRSMLARVVARLRRQVSRIVVSANGDPARFAEFGLPVVADTVTGFAGPLAGVLAGLRWAGANAPEATDLVSVSADAPIIPRDLVERLLQGREGGVSSIVAAACQGQTHHVIALWPVALADEIEAALRRGEGAVHALQERLGARHVDFAPLEAGGRSVDPFFNVNTPEDLALAEQLVRRPVIGLAGWKNSGKTTLAVRLIEELTRRGYRVATVKHSHHEIALGDGTRDSDRHKAAGAVEVAVVSPKRWMLGGTVYDETEPPLADVMSQLAPADIVLVEGFKRETMPKIEVRRRGQGEGAVLADTYPDVIAIAADHEVTGARVPVLALDDVQGLVRKIIEVAGLAPRSPS